MTAIRFDAGENQRVEEPDEEWPLDDVLWYLTDDHSNGRWLYVDHPDESGYVHLGIQRVYQKYLSPEATRELAAALLVAAEVGEVIRARIRAERGEQSRRVRECETDGGHQWGPPPLTVTHATSAVMVSGDVVRSTRYLVCRRCEHGKWFDD